MAKLNPYPQIPNTDKDISALLTNVRHHAHDILLSLGYTRSQIAETFASCPDFSLPKLLTKKPRNNNRAWQQRRLLEVLEYALRCERAWHDRRWEDALKAAYFMGVSEGSLFMKESELAPNRKGALIAANKKNSVWSEILAAADRISSSNNQEGSLKHLHADVMAISGMPQRGINAFRERWKAHRSKKVSR